MADREEGNIKNYAGPKILLESLSFHGDFAPGGGGLGVGWGRDFPAFGGTRLCSGSVANSIKLAPRYWPYADRNGCHLRRDRTLYASMMTRRSLWEVSRRRCYLQQTQEQATS